MKNRIFLFWVCSVCFLSTSMGQETVKNWFDKDDSVYGYYTTIKPASPLIQGVLVLLDGYGGTAESIFPETKIQNVAYVNQILTVCIPTGMRLTADTAIVQNMNRILSDVVATYHMKKNQFAIGGMSIGGTIALRYAELCHEKPDAYPVLPSALFDVDAPVDLAGLYQFSERELARDFPGPWIQESKTVISKLKKNIGDPEKVPHKFAEASPFSVNTKEPGNEKYLKDVAYRTYHDLDVNWNIQQRRRSLYDANSLNSSELVNRLVLMGNTNAEFVSSKIEGRRSNGQRNPHSWNIADEIDLVQWLKDKMHFYPDHIERPYTYTAPANYTKELILFPLDFAPSIPFQGFEDLRFAPGFADSTSYQKWGYTILWWINDSVALNDDSLKQYLESYYSGLTMRRMLHDKLDTTLYKPAQVLVQKTSTLKGDLETYYATAFIYDAQVTRKPGELYYKIHVKDCGDRSKTLVLIEVAENSFTEPIWKELGKINEDFKCGK